jgi:sodium/proline symporter
MSIRSEKEMKKSQIIGIGWIAIILVMATVVGIVGHEYLGSSVDPTKNLVFIDMVKKIFGYGALALIGGLMLSAIVAAAMSTADSQLLSASSSFASDIYKTTIRKKASEKEMLWVSRGTVAGVLIIAFFIAINPASGGIMGLVESAWAFFGAAFGPTVILALYWKRFNYQGAVSSILTGFAVSIFWLFAFNNGADSFIFNTGLYELVPGFVIGLIAAVVVTLLTKKPSEEVVALFDSVKPIEE